MKEHKLGIIMNGVTGRMGTNQHLIRSICAIRDQGGVQVSPDEIITVDPILTGRNENKLGALADRTGVERWTTNLDEALADPGNQIFFDAAHPSSGPVRGDGGQSRQRFTVKPTAVTTEEALRLAKLCEDAGVKNGAVQDKLWLPGIRKLKTLIKQGFFGEILSVRGEFGYWVFTGHEEDQPAQRPSWNYRKEDGGGIIIDMLCHWRYLVDNVFGPIKSISCRGATHVAERVDEQGNPYKCTADDSCYATMELENGILCHFNSSWTVRVRRDDLFVMQVDGSKGSAVVNLRGCQTQGLGVTPSQSGIRISNNRLIFTKAGPKCRTRPPMTTLSRSSAGNFSRATLLSTSLFLMICASGAKGVELAEVGLQSWEERKWIDL